MDKMLNPNGRRMFSGRPRPRTLLLIALAAVTTYYLVFSGPAPQLHVVTQLHNGGDSQGGIVPKPATGTDGEFYSESQQKGQWDFEIEDIKGWRDPDDHEDPDDVEPGYETDGKERDPGQISRLQREKDLRRMWRYAYKMSAE